MWLNRALSVTSSASRPRRIAACAALGGVAALGQAPFGLPLASLAAFTLVFLAVAESPDDKRAASLGWCFGLGYFIVTLHWLVAPFFVEPERHGWMAPFAVFFMAAGLSLFWALAFAAAKRLGWGALALTLPLAELARAYLFTGFPWGMPAYGLIDTQLAQAAAFVGVHGVNALFLAVAFAAALAYRSSGARRIAAAGISCVGLLGFLPGPAPDVAAKDAAMIRLVQPNAPQHQKWDLAYMPIFFDRALDFTAVPDPVDLIIWPETSLPASLPGGAEAVVEMRDAASGVPVVFGANRFEGPLLRNSAALLNETGEITATYDKHHLVPFGEYMPFGEALASFGIYGFAASQGRGFSPGPGAALMDLGPLGKALPLICYEAVFPQDVNAYQTRPDFLMHITNDAWFGSFSGPYQHLVQAQMRAIEQGLPLVRAANTGVSAVIDARGRITAALPLNKAGYLDAQLPARHAHTLYARTGDIAVFLILLGVAVATGLMKRRFSR